MGVKRQFTFQGEGDVPWPEAAKPAKRQPKAEPEALSGEEAEAAVQAAFERIEERERKEVEDGDD